MRWSRSGAIDAARRAWLQGADRFWVQSRRCVPSKMHGRLAAGFCQRRKGRRLPRILRRDDGPIVHPKVVAVGETGFDFYYRHSSPEDQEAAFRAQITLAQQLGLA